MNSRTATVAAGLLLLVALVAVAEADTDAGDGNAVLADTDIEAGTDAFPGSAFLVS
jgi:hypothetical protein